MGPLRCGVCSSSSIQADSSLDDLDDSLQLLFIVFRKLAVWESTGLGFVMSVRVYQVLSFESSGVWRTERL